MGDWKGWGRGNGKERGGSRKWRCMGEECCTTKLIKGSEIGRRKGGEKGRMEWGNREGGCMREDCCTTVEEMGD